MSYPSNSEPVAQDQLQSYFDRWRRLEDEKASISTDLKELFVEAKSHGFDSKAMRAAFRRKVESEDAETVAKVEEFDAIVDLYLSAISGTPLATRAGRAQAHEKPKGRVGQPGQPAAEVEQSSVSGSRPDASLEDRDPRAGSNPAPIPLTQSGEAPAPNKQWKYTDKPHPDCLDPTQCGGFSNLGLCQRCKDAAGVAA